MFIHTRVRDGQCVSRRIERLSEARSGRSARLQAAMRRRSPAASGPCVHAALRPAWLRPPGRFLRYRTSGEESRRAAGPSAPPAAACAGTASSPALRNNTSTTLSAPDTITTDQELSKTKYTNIQITSCWIRLLLWSSSG